MYIKDSPVVYKNRFHADFDWVSFRVRVRPLFHPYQGSEDSSKRLETHNNMD